MHFDPSCADARGGRRDSAYLEPNPVVFRIRIAARVHRRIVLFTDSIVFYRKCAGSLLAKCFGCEIPRNKLVSSKSFELASAKCFTSYDIESEAERTLFGKAYLYAFESTEGSTEGSRRRRSGPSCAWVSTLGHTSVVEDDVQCSAVQCSLF